MKISISGIYDRGDIQKERLHFRADVALDLSFYVLLDTVYQGPSSVSAGNLSAHWFGPRQIARGEHVVVYTRFGNPSVEKRDNGSVYHFLFRGLATPLYTMPNSCAVLIEAQTWASTQRDITVLPPLPPIEPGAYSLAEMLKSLDQPSSMGQPETPSVLRGLLGDSFLKKT